MRVLGIESSCDETSVAVIIDEEVVVNLVSSQDFHTLYGGVVPELSSRAHIQRLIPLVKNALIKSNLSINDIDLIAATAGPGLIGALLVGFTFAKSLAFSLNKPFVAVNHIEGHIFSGWLNNEKPQFPALILVVSGGHTLLMLARSFTDVIKLGTTIDDAAGEAFDKVAKLLNLGYPGGPKIQKMAELGNPEKTRFPIADLKNRYDFSFSGLKTAVLRYLQNNYEPNEKQKNMRIIPEADIPDIAASFQFAAVKALTRSVKRALKDYDIKSLSLAGGVAANKYLRNAMIELGKENNKQVVIPPFEYCGDNAAMIAFRALTQAKAGMFSDYYSDTFPSLPDNWMQSK